MTDREKKNRVIVEHNKIAAFGSRWNDVLTALQLPLITQRGKQPRGRGGESQAPLALNQCVYDHPELVGASRHWKAFLEYPLPSFDEIDVVFKSTHKCIAVEVKSAISDNYPLDYERGIYQVVKYDALLRAMSLDGAQNIPIHVDVVLLLESQLPLIYRCLARNLAVRVIENVKPNVDRETGDYP